MIRLALCAALGAALGGCAAVQKSVEPLAVVREASDRDQYAMRRVAILPVAARDMRPEEAQALQAALAQRLSEHLHAEILVLSRGDAAEIPDHDAYRTGRIEPAAVLGLAHRFRVDGLVSVIVTERRTYAPQRLGLEVELSSCDTGLPIWTASLRLDGAEERTQDALRAWFEAERGPSTTNESVELYLLSPQRFAEFAAAQVGMAY